MDMGVGMGMAAPNATIAAPFVVSPSFRFDGDDGAWSTFNIQIGTPPQSFRILPATVGQEVWIPIPEGCEGIMSGVSDCGDLRGADSQSNRGFKYTGSSTWNQTGPFQLVAEQYLYGTEDSGLYGLDTVTLDSALEGSSEATVDGQTVAGIATANFWLGSMGLGTSAGTFNAKGVSTPSLLVSLKERNLTTSLSYGYTAGQAYASPSLPGSLVLGGYDQARLSDDAISMNVTNSVSQRLEVQVQNIVATQTLAGSIQKLQLSPIVANLDSATSQLWLPLETCKNFEQAFGLLYDNNTDLYRINNTVHSQLKQNNPSVTFTVGSGTTTTNIEMHYNAFDLNADIPLYNDSTPYFPLRRAANESQYALGRVFLQEAYIVVDWDRNNLTIGQTTPQNTTTHIVPILPPSAGSAISATPMPTSTPAAAHKSTNTGMIAGIVVAVIAILAIAVGVGYCIYRRKRRSSGSPTAGMEAINSFQPHGTVEYFGHNDPSSGMYKPLSGVHVSDLSRAGSPGMPEMDGGVYTHERKRSELGSADVHEMEDIVKNRELMSTPIYELQGDGISSEMGIVPNSPTSPVRVSGASRTDYFGPGAIANLDSQVVGSAQVSPPLPEEDKPNDESRMSGIVSPLTNSPQPNRKGAISPVSDGTAADKVGEEEATDTIQVTPLPSPDFKVTPLPSPELKVSPVPSPDPKA